jgi:hypothetical protein
LICKLIRYQSLCPFSRSPLRFTIPLFPCKKEGELEEEELEEEEEEEGGGGGGGVRRRKRRRPALGAYLSHEVREMDVAKDESIK